MTKHHISPIYDAVNSKWHKQPITLQDGKQYYCVCYELLSDAYKAIEHADKVLGRPVELRRHGDQYAVLYPSKEDYAYAELLK